MLVVKPRFPTNVSDIAVSADGRWLLASPGYMPTFEPDPDDPTAKAHRFDFKYWPLPKPTKKAKTFPAERPRAVRFLPSGELFVERWAPEPLVVFRFPDGTRTQTPFADREHAIPGGVSPDGRFLFVNTFTPQMVPQLRLWDLTAGAEVELKRTAFKHETDLTGLPAVHPAGDRAASNPRTRVQSVSDTLRQHVAVWEFPTGKLIRSTTLKKGLLVGPVTYTPDGRHLIAVDSNTVYVWDADTLAAVAEVTPELACKTGGPVNPRLFGPTFTPDGRFLALGCYDGTVRLIDARTWTEARAYDWGAATTTEWNRQHGHAAVRKVLFTPDGAMAVAAVGFDLVLWDME